MQLLVNRWADCAIGVASLPIAPGSKKTVVPHPRFNHNRLQAWSSCETARNAPCNLARGTRPRADVPPCSRSPPSVSKDPDPRGPYRRKGWSRDTAPRADAPRSLLRFAVGLKPLRMTTGSPGPWPGVFVCIRSEAPGLPAWRKLGTPPYLRLRPGPRRTRDCGPASAVPAIAARPPPYPRLRPGLRRTRDSRVPAWTWRCAPVAAH